MRKLLVGECLARLPELPASVADSLVTDPPAGISFMGKEWDANKGGRSEWVAWLAQVMAESMRVLKPGAHGLVWALPRTSHWTATALEDTGFEIRDVITHHFGTGFPKSLDVSKAIDKQRTEDRPDIEAVRSFLREARNKAGLTNRAIGDAFGFSSTMAAHWIDHPTQPTLPTWEQWGLLKTLLGLGSEIDSEVWRLNGRKGKPGDTWESAAIIGEHAGSPGGLGGQRFAVRDNTIREASDAAKQWQGWGTALKPASEHWILIRKPLEKATVAANVLEHGTGALNIDGARIPTNGERPTGSGDRRGGAIYAQDEYTRERMANGGNMTPAEGRWPANLVLSHSDDCGDECAAGCPVAELDRQSGTTKDGTAGKRGEVGTFNPGGYDKAWGTYGGQGGASRFFYVAKASTNERNAGLGDSKNAHPTVKALALMRYLCRLITPPGGTILDPFMGSGSTGVAALQEGFDFIGIEREQEYFDIAKARILACRDALQTAIKESA